MTRDSIEVGIDPARAGRRGILAGMVSQAYYTILQGMFNRSIRCGAPKPAARPQFGRLSERTLGTAAKSLSLPSWATRHISHFGRHRKAAGSAQKSPFGQAEAWFQGCH